MHQQICDRENSGENGQGITLQNKPIPSENQTTCFRTIGPKCINILPFYVKCGVAEMH